MNNPNYYYFNKKYKTKDEKKKDFCLNIKQTLFSFLSENKYFKKKLSSIDGSYEYRNKREAHIAKNYYSSRLKLNPEIENYRDLKLSYISFF